MVYYIYLLIAITVIKELVVSALPLWCLAVILAACVCLTVFFTVQNLRLSSPFHRFARMNYYISQFFIRYLGQPPSDYMEFVSEYIVLLILIAISFICWKHQKGSVCTCIWRLFYFNIISYLLTYIPYSWIRFTYRYSKHILCFTGIALTNEAQKRTIYCSILAALGLYYCRSC